MMATKRIEVVAAVIEHNGTYLATERGYGEFEGWWEFPGGKIEQGETNAEALQREIHEELDMDITVGELLCTAECEYPAFHLTMHCHLCHMASGQPHLLEHKAARWLTLEDIDSVNWLPADVEAVEALKKRASNTR